MDATVTCPFCNDYDDGPESVIAHVVSLTDEDHKGIGYTKARSLVDQRVGTSEPAPEDGENSESESENEPEIRDDSENQAQRATDGGPRPPPEPETVSEDDVDDDQYERGVDDLPDHVIPVEEYIDGVASAEHVDAGELEDALEGYDVVDVERTDTETVVAWSMEDARDRY